MPYRGDPAVLTDVLGGNVDVGALVGGTVIGQNVRVLGIFAEERHPALPDAPTVKEQGFPVAPISFGGLLAPAATPQADSGQAGKGLRRRGEGRGLCHGRQPRGAAAEQLRQPRRYLLRVSRMRSSRRGV